MEFKFLDPESSLYRFAEWVQRLVFLNILWILFTLLGLVIFGITPATVALFNIINKFVKGNENVSIFSTFWKQYKLNFIRANLLGIILFIIGYILYFDIQYFRVQEGMLYFFLYYGVLILSFLYLIVLLYIFPIYVNYDLKIYYMLKNALFISFLTPLKTLLIMGGIVGLYFVFMLLPSLLPFLSISTLSYIIMLFTSQSFSKVEQKIKHHQQKQDS